jgi:1,4-dihydroxy-2-naphthoate octaprenyltransferase
MTDKPSLFKIWWLAIRPKTLPAAIAPVLIGAGLASQQTLFRPLALLAALFGAIMIQIGANLVNDVADFAKGADTPARLGPARVTASGFLSARQVWAGVWVSFGLATLAGVYLVWIGGWPVVAIGVTSILAALAYTTGPYPLAYIGIADLFVMIFFGFVAVLGTEYVVSGVPSTAGWGYGAALGALIVNILVVNNIRDIETDRAAGRNNIPVRFGRTAAEWEYSLMLVLAYGIPLVLVGLGLAPIWVLLAWLTSPQAWRLLQTLRGGLAGPGLNPILGQTAQLAFRYALLTTVGFVIALYL